MSKRTHRHRRVSRRLRREAALDLTLSSSLEENGGENKHVSRSSSAPPAPQPSTLDIFDSRSSTNSNSDLPSHTGEPLPHSGRHPSPLLASDFSFREDTLIDHYLDSHFSRQFDNKVLRPSDLPTRETIMELISSNPALRHAVCALAATSLQNGQRSLDNERFAHLGMSLAFLRRRLLENKIDEALLFAIIQLTDIDRVSGAHSSWRVHLDAALSVVTSMPFANLSIGEMTRLQRLFIRTLTFWDIMASAVVCRRPVLFLRHIHNLSIGIGVQYLCGCNDLTLSALNHATDLEAWKAERQCAGDLSIGDLYKGGMRIIRQLLAINRSWPKLSLSGAVADAFLFAAIIFVNIIMSGGFSALEEIQKPMSNLVETLGLLMPHTDALRLLCWPIMIGGTLALSSNRKVFKEVCQRLDGLGDFYQILKVLEKAWEMRDGGRHVETHWRKIMEDLGYRLMLV